MSDKGFREKLAELVQQHLHETAGVNFSDVVAAAHEQQRKAVLNGLRDKARQARDPQLACYRTLVDMSTIPFYQVTPMQEHFKRLFVCDDADLVHGLLTKRDTQALLANANAQAGRDHIERLMKDTDLADNIRANMKALRARLCSRLLQPLSPAEQQKLDGCLQHFGDKVPTASACYWRLYNDVYKEQHHSGRPTQEADNAERLIRASLKCTIDQLSPSFVNIRNKVIARAMDPASESNLYPTRKVEEVLLPILPEFVLARDDCFASLLEKRRHDLAV